MTQSSLITDPQFIAFLDVVAADQRGKNGLCLTEWEENFLRTFMACGRGFFLTDGRRKAIDRMWRKYGAELGHLHPLDTVSERPKIEEADAGGCQYLVRDDDAGGRQRRCNAPATCREPGRLRYCEAHGEAVKRAVKGITLVNL